MIVRKTNKKIRSNRNDVIMYQILTYCFFNKIKVSDTELELLTELSINNGVEVNDLCQQLSVKCIYRTKQSARNAISKVEKKNLILKDGDARKKRVYISEDIGINTHSVILLDMKILGE